jgi:hypothetical protein|tara:strand:+ start:431 stop:661 length:231 start_codon:yes stop_codon:yes gene_type:complete
MTQEHHEELKDHRDTKNKAEAYERRKNKVEPTGASSSYKDPSLNELKADHKHFLYKHKVSSTLEDLVKKINGLLKS